MSSISFHRSPISAYHIQIGNTSVEQHPRVCTLMTGIFKNRPLKPRHTFCLGYSKSPHQITR